MSNDNQPVYLILGGNQGDRRANLEKAAGMLEKRAGQIGARSSIYETQPWGFSDENLFLNQVIMLRTSLSPDRLLEEIHKIETSLGRIREPGGYRPRSIDIDILFYDDLILDRPDLTIPHPLLRDRRFVLVPLNEIAGDLVHPVFHCRIPELLDLCTDLSEVRRLEA
jgi:2-amino-4-hydroxy-6-hydroxymethyldihydropteridine diphosphokinase